MQTMLSLPMRTSLAFMACLSLAEGFSSHHPSSAGRSTSLVVVRHAKSPDRARFEREMDEAMDNDWRLFRAKLVAAEKSGGTMVWANQPPVYSFQNHKRTSSLFQPDLDHSGVNSAEFFSVEDHGQVDDTTHHRPLTSHHHESSSFMKYQTNWHSSKHPSSCRLDQNEPYTYRTNPTGAYVRRDPYCADHDPNTAYDSYNANNNAPKQSHGQQPSDLYVPQSTASLAFQQKTNFRERPNLLSCDNGKHGQPQEYRYQNPNTAQANWNSARTPRGAYVSNSASVRSNRPPSRKYFSTKNTEMPWPGTMQMKSKVGTGAAFPNTNSILMTTSGSKNKPTLLEEDPFISEAMCRQIKADFPSLSPKTRINKHRWAHEIPGIEKGAVLVATERVNDVFQQTIVLITQHHEVNGTYGVVVNRPLPGNLMSVCKEPSLTIDSSLKRTFRNTAVGYGGPMMPNEYTILHSFGEVTGAHKICHGVYMGGSHELMNQVRAGKLDDREAMFIKGHIMWKQGELQKELAGGYWYLAAVSPDMILRYAGVESMAENEPDNLWLDIMTCMGGQFETAAQQCRGKGDKKGRFMP